MNKVITTTNLSMHYRKCDALRDVNFHVDRGTVFALLGENGAGKTTMIRIFTGFQKPSAGGCNVCGIDPSSKPLELRRRIGYVSDAPALYDWMNVGQIGWFAASFYDRVYLDRYRESIRRYEIPEHQKIRQLSRGQRAKVALSLSLASDPELLILDEPTSGLDPMVRREFLESMIDRAAAGRTVFLSSHQISEVERVADTIGILHRGELQLVCPLAELKSSVTELTINLDDPLLASPILPEPADILDEQSFGRQRRLVVRNYENEMRERLMSQSGVEEVRPRDLSLEEIFLAYTGKSFRQSPDGPRREAESAGKMQNGHTSRTVSTGEQA